MLRPSLHALCQCRGTPLCTQNNPDWKNASKDPIATSSECMTVGHPTRAGKGVGLDVPIIIASESAPEDAPNQNPCRYLIDPDAGPDLAEVVDDVQFSGTNV